MHLEVDTYACGHVKSEENTTYSAAKGKRYPRCLTCNNARSRERQEKKRRANGVMTVEEARMAKKSKTASTDHLKLPPAAIKAEHILHLAYEDARGNCDDRPEAWIDYDEDNPPQRSVARAMCADCPLFQQCGEYAAKIKPAIGVWAGKIYQDGKVV